MLPGTAFNQSLDLLYTYPSSKAWTCCIPTPPPSPPRRVLIARDAPSCTPGASRAMIPSRDAGPWGEPQHPASPTPRLQWAVLLGRAASMCWRRFHPSRSPCSGGIRMLLNQGGAAPGGEGERAHPRGSWDQALGTRLSSGALGVRCQSGEHEVPGGSGDSRVQMISFSGIFFWRWGSNPGPHEC